MRYLVTHPDYPPFLTHVFSPDNHLSDGMVVFDLADKTYMVDGSNWMPISIDNL